MDDNHKRRREEIYPPYSNLFIICDKKTTVDDFREAFSPYGTIEDIRIPKHHDTGEPKGLAYVKFAKTSEAAKALEELNRKTIGNSTKPLKVLLASSRSEIHSSDEDRSGSSHTRLFIAIPHSEPEDVVSEHFSQYGRDVFITYQWDKNTGQHKNFAFVNFNTFYDAAVAYENCAKRYRPIFAEPKRQARKRPHSDHGNSSSQSNKQGLFPYMNIQPKGYVKIQYMCCPYLTKDQVKMLFDLVPGMVHVDHFVDLLNNYGKGNVEYSNPASAAYAVEKLHKFEYPPGLQIFVRPDRSQFSESEKNFNNLPNVYNKLNNAIKSSKNSSAPDLAALTEAVAEASKMIKMATAGLTEELTDESINYCSVKLPPPQPLAGIDSQVAKRCFLVCKPSPPSLTVLRDVFCRFGDLINVYTLPNKIVGYARYASAQAADEAIRVLHGAEICGVRIKVLEAEEEKFPKRSSYDY